MSESPAIGGAAAAQPASARSPAERLFGSGWFWLGVVALMAGFTIVRSMAARVPEPPKVLAELPAFTLTDQTGEPFGSKDLQGRIWIANFIFTSCPTVCPKLTETMQRIKRRVRGMGEAVHLVSFSVDPERDTPKVLLDYSLKYGASPDQWSFLTGPLDEIERTVIQGFKLPIDRSAPDEAEEPSLFDITHGNRFVLVDTENRVRGYYVAEPQDLDRLMHDISVLAAQEQRAAVKALEREVERRRRGAPTAP
jgi:protein SCO1/2